MVQQSASQTAVFIVVCELCTESFYQIVGTARESRGSRGGVAEVVSSESMAQENPYIKISVYKRV